MSKNDLESINVVSGVNEEGKGFCTISAVSEGGDIFLGQLTPNEVRLMALNYLAAAEAAETDAIVYRLLRDEFNLDLHVIGAFITAMREAREP